MFKNWHGVAASPAFPRAAVVGALVCVALTGAALSACGDAGGTGGTGGTGTTGSTGSTGGAGGTPPVVDPVPLGLNDVSVLFPLPLNLSDPAHLRAKDVGARGELLPSDVFKAIPTFPVTPSEGLVYTRMRAVAVRFDGCGGVPDACQPEIRVVMQPAEADGSMRDSALHLFYHLDEEAMRQVVDGLRALRPLAPEAAVEGPLDVHPALVAQGVLGAYGAELRKLVLQHIGEQNLARVTFFLRAPPVNEVWFFGGFDRKDGVLTAMDVVGVGTDPQRVILTKTDTTYDYDLTPLGQTPEDGRVFYSSAAAEAATEEKRNAAMASYLRVENPAVHVPDQLPCAGCHMSAFVTAEATRRFAIDPATFNADRFTSSKHDLTMRGGAAGNPSSLRAFGYFGAEPMIAQRTINDSAAVVADLEKRYPEQKAP